MKTYSTIIKETTNTICVAYPNENGIETEFSLNDYEAKSQGLVELIFVETQNEARELLKTF